MKTKQWAKKLFRSASSKSSSSPSAAIPSIPTTGKSLNSKSTSSSLSSQFYSHSTSSVSSVPTAKKQSARKIFRFVDGNGSVNSLLSFTFKSNGEQDVRTDSLHYDVNASTATSSPSKNKLIIPAESQEQPETTTLYYYPPSNEKEKDFVPKLKFHQEHQCQKEKETQTKSRQDITMIDQLSAPESGTQCSRQYRQLESPSAYQTPPKSLSHLGALSSEKHTKIPQGPHYHRHQHQQQRAPALRPDDAGADPKLRHYYLSDADRVSKVPVDIMDKSTASSLTRSNSRCDRTNADCTRQVPLGSNGSLCCSFKATSQHFQSRLPEEILTQHTTEKTSYERLAKAVDGLSGVVEDLSRKIVMMMNESDDIASSPRNQDECCSSLPLLSASTPSLPDLSNELSCSGLRILIPSRRRSLSNIGGTCPSITKAPIRDDGRMRPLALTKSKSLCASRIETPLPPPPQRPLQRPPQPSRASPSPLIPSPSMEARSSGRSRRLCSSPVVGTVCSPDELVVPTTLQCNTPTALDYSIQSRNFDSVRRDFMEDFTRTVPTKSVMRSRSCAGLKAAKSPGYESQANRSHGARKRKTPTILNAGPSAHPNVASSKWPSNNPQGRGGRGPREILTPLDFSGTIGYPAPYSEISRQNTPTPPPRPARPSEDLCQILKHIELDIARFEWTELFTRGITDSKVGDQIMRI